MRKTTDLKVGDNVTYKDKPWVVTNVQGYFVNGTTGQSGPLVRIEPVDGGRGNIVAAEDCTK